MNALGKGSSQPDEKEKVAITYSRRKIFKNVATNDTTGQAFNEDLVKKVFAKFQPQ